MRQKLPRSWVLLFGHCVVMRLLVGAETKVSSGFGIIGISSSFKWWSGTISYCVVLLEGWNNYIIWSQHHRLTRIGEANLFYFRIFPTNISNMHCLRWFMWAFHNSQWIVSRLGLNICTSRGRLFTRFHQPQEMIQYCRSTSFYVFWKKTNLEECWKVEVILLPFSF